MNEDCHIELLPKFVSGMSMSWIQILKKHGTIKKTPWTEEEDRILFHNQECLGNKWTKIREKLPGRTQTDVKNRYYNQKRRKLARC
mmetsp:Transcript_21619/g.21929  ORF Transcript_21619/g.21929 Transcript_21619/m.21929 type:complete len:86 (+) Transcript_21619:80-337(+)